MERFSTILENGITIVSEHAPHAHRAAVSVNILAGSVHEPESQSGLAHLLEHVVFRGAADMSDAEMSDAIEDLGGHVNAQTFFDRTMYFGSVIREDLERTIELLAKIVIRPMLNADHVELEKNIVEDENCRGCYGCTMQETYLDSAYPGEALSRPIIGFEDTVAGLTVEHLRDFHDRFYVSENVVVSVCADVEHSAVVDMVRTAFASMPQGTKSQLPSLAYQGGDMQMNTRSEDSGVWIGFDVTDMSINELRALWLFGDILGGHGHSVLMDELREKRGLVYGVSSEMDTYAKRDHFRIYLNGNSSKISEICEVAVDTLRGLAENVTDQNLAKAKRRHHVNNLMGRDSLEARAVDMVTDIAELGKTTDVEERLQAYQVLTSKQLEQAAQKMLSSTPTIVISAPMRQAPKVTDLRDRIAGRSAHGGVLGFFKRAS